MNPFLRRFNPELEQEYFEYIRKRSLSSLRFTGIIGALYTFALCFRDYSISGDVNTIYFRLFQSFILLGAIGLSNLKSIQPKIHFLSIMGALSVFTSQVIMHHLELIPSFALGNTVPLLIIAIAIGLGLTFNKALVTNALIVVIMFIGAYVYNEPHYASNMVNILLNFGIATGLGYLFEREIRIGFHQLKKVESLNQELRKADKMKLQLLSIISHDINSPLANLESTIDLSKIVKLSDVEFNSFMKIIKLKLHSISHILFGITNWSKSQIDGFKPDFKPTNLVKVINDVEEGIRFLLEDKNIELKHSINANSTVYSDENMLGIIIRNILANSIKYSSEGSTVDVSESVSGDQIKLEITDFGKGMSEELIEKLFVYNVASSRGTNEELGSGLGMYISMQLAHFINIDLKVNSELGKFTTFTLLIPISEPK
ncbi:MAG: ATP-binding protein [Salibacteraceae bacterium]